MNGKTFAKKIRGSVTGWLFLLPMTFGICVFTLLPIAQSLWYSFYDYDVVSKFNFVGFGNYVKVFRDPVMGKVVGNTLLFAVVNIPVVMVGSYLLALLLNTNVPRDLLSAVRYAGDRGRNCVELRYALRRNGGKPGVFQHDFAFSRA